MRKYIIGTAAVGLILTLWACSQSFLETAPADQLSSTNFFKTSDDFNSFIIGGYHEMQGDPASGLDWPTTSAIASLDMRYNEATKVDYQKFFNPNGSYHQLAGNSYYTLWNQAYTIVSKTNLVIEQLQKANFKSTISDDDKKLFDGEAKFLRGFAYLLLGRGFGGVPLVLKTNNATDSKLVKKNTETEVWTQVVSDLKEASDKLPVDWPNPSNNLGRATKGAALAYLANAYMYLKDWSNAAKASEDLLALNKYSLLPNYREVFSAQKPNNEESIFEVQYRIVNSPVWGNLPENGHYFDEYTAPRKIGNDYAPDGGWGECPMSPELGTSFEPGDYRRDTCVLGIGETYLGEKMKKAVLLTAKFAPTGYFCTKYWLGPLAGSIGLYSDQNLPQMRLSDVYLSYAEILNESGRTSEAYTYLNKVRSRAGLPDKSGSDKSVCLDDIMMERRHELFFEPNLWYHWTRTRQAEKLYAKYGYTFNPNWYYFPIPQPEINVNSDLQQNTGY